MLTSKPGKKSSQTLCFILLRLLNLLPLLPPCCWNSKINPDTNTPLQQMFADTQFRGVDVSKISIKQLLTHQSGLDNQPLVWATAYSGIHTPASLKALVAGSYPDAESKTGQFNYSNVGYNILSTWLDQQSDLSWQQQLQTLIFTPLQMQHSSTLVSEAKRKNWMLAKPYSAMSPNPAQELYLQKTDRTMHAAGGMLATAPDLAKFLIAQMQDGGAVFPETVIKKAQQTEVITTATTTILTAQVTPGAGTAVTTKVSACCIILAVLLVFTPICLLFRRKIRFSGAEQRRLF